MIGWLKWGSTGVRVSSMATLADVLTVVRDLVRFSQAASEFLTAVAKSELLQGVMRTVTMDGTTNAQYFPHGLTGSYRGAVHVGQTDTTNPVTLMSPAEVMANGQDPKTVFGARPSAATTAVVGVLVF